MRASLHKMAMRRSAGPTNAQLMRLVRFPSIRRSISAALLSALPEKVAVHAGGTYVRFRLADHRSFHPGLFATIPAGNRGTLLVIGTPKSAVKKPRELEAFIRRMGRGIHAEARRSLIYQLRQAGIIGGSRVQAVLVPRARVLSAASMYLGSRAGRVAANPILATIGFNPDAAPAPAAPMPAKPAAPAPAAPSPAPAAKANARRGRWKNPLTTMESAELVSDASYFARQARKMTRMSPRAASYFAGRAVGESQAVRKYGVKRAHRVADRINHRAGNAAHLASVAANPGAVEITVPFRDGQKITPTRMRQWIASLPNNPITRLIKARFEQGMRQYKRFHLGSEPTSFTYRAIPMGSQGKRITDVDVVVSEGKEWAAPYQVPKSSKKYDPRVEGRYIHAHGESKMDIDIKKAASTKLLPERFHTADGKFVGVVPSRNVKITDWYRG
jgi:hypothetical protein